MIHFALQPECVITSIAMQVDGKTRVVPETTAHKNGTIVWI